MKIKNVKPIPLSSEYGDGKVFGQPLSKKSIILVEIETYDGVKGLGETYSGVYVPELAIQVVTFFSNLLQDVDINNFTNLNTIRDIPYVGRSGLMLSVWSAIDIAIWDLRAKYEKKPLYKLLSENFSNEKSIYSSGGSVTFNSEQIQNDINKCLKNGHNSFKMRVGYQNWEEDLKRVACARETLGSDKNLMIDSIMGSLRPCWSLNEAIIKIDELSKYNIYWIEEPLHPANLTDHISLREKSKIKIASGEALTGSLEYQAFILSNAIDILQLDVTHCGGISSAIEILKLANKKRIPIALHIWGSPISFAANINLAMCNDIIDWVEQPNVFLELSNSFKIFEFKITNGKIKINGDFLGHGSTYNEEKLKKYSFIEGTGWKL